MTIWTRHLRRLSLQALAAAVAALAMAPAAGASTTVTPLPESDYRTRPVCGPPSAGHASCLSRELVPVTAAAKARRHPLGVAAARLAAEPSPAGGSYGLRPQDLHSAYSLPAGAAGEQTIAIVDAYNDFNAATDLAEYSKEFGLPECTVASGCFKQVNERGEASGLPFPKTAKQLEEASAAEREEAEGWGVEISLDIETAHGICQSCRILLVEASTPSPEDLEAGVRSAERLGAGEISNSWGLPEFFAPTSAQEGASAFNDPGVVITASAGDFGYLDWQGEGFRGYAEFPSSSPHVVAVGGTRLILGKESHEWKEESTWNGNGAGGGGCSVRYGAQAWQLAVPDWSSVGCGGGRAVADVSADADPYTGVAVHDTSRECADEEKPSVHWCTIGGTSLSSPLIASVFALAGGAQGAAYPARSLYEGLAAEPSSLHDITRGSNGECTKGFNLVTGIAECSEEEEGHQCKQRFICRAASGYDGPSGVGTPDGLAAFTPRSSGGGGGEEPPAGEGAPPVSPSSPPASPAPAPGAPSSAPPPPTTGTPPALQLSGLTLTVRALVALNRPRPRLSALAFAFTVNLPARLHVVVYRRVRRHGRTSWHKLVAPAPFSVHSGRSTHALHGRTPLPGGVYRLTLSATTASRTIQFRIG